MHITHTLARIVAALTITVLLNGALVAAFDNVAAHSEAAKIAAPHVA
jgi:hypothetical protein